MCVLIDDARRTQLPGVGPDHLRRFQDRVGLLSTPGATAYRKWQRIGEEATKIRILEYNEHDNLAVGRLQGILRGLPVRS